MGTGRRGGAMDGDRMLRIFFLASFLFFLAAQFSFADDRPPLQLTTPEARQFRTRLAEAARQKSNFAGHYILTTWGCGSGCLMPAIIDADNGKVFMIPFTVTTVGEKVIEPLQFDLKSNLLIVNGSRNDGLENGTFYYKWENDRLELIRLRLKP